jgi:hypothetical protein
MAARLESARVAASDASRVAVLDASGGRREVPMRREAGGWRVDLVPLLDRKEP